MAHGKVKSCLNDCPEVGRCPGDSCEDPCMFKCWLQDEKEENERLRAENALMKEAMSKPYPMSWLITKTGRKECDV